MKVSIAGVDTPDSVFPHQDRCVGIMKKVSADERELGQNLRENAAVPLRRDEKADRGGSQESFDEGPSLASRKRSLENPWVGRNPEEFVDDPPGQIPGRGLSSPLLDPRPARRVKRRILIGRIDEDIRIDDEHYRPSMA